MKRGTLWMLGACLAVATSSYLATVWAAAPATVAAASVSPICSWLAMTPAQQRQVADIDPAFDAESAALSNDVRSARARLVLLLETPQTSDAEILEQVDRVAAAERLLQRRVTEYLLRVRGHLTAEQQVRLLSLYGGAMGAQGRGQGGPGRGLGPRYRGGRGDPL